MSSCRDGVSWIDAARPGGEFDFRATLPMVRAAARHGIAVTWDLLHFGWPDDVNIFSASFPALFARYAAAFARWYTGESDAPPVVAPVNEISFLAWAGGDAACMNPFETRRGADLKRQLVRAEIEAIDAIRSIAPAARFLHPDPVIFVHPNGNAEPPGPNGNGSGNGKLHHYLADGSIDRGQWEAWDMLAGQLHPSLGGGTNYLDVIGVNFYPHNQFTTEGVTVWPGDPRYRPFSQLLLVVWERYRRPILVSETGTEGDARAPWLRYVTEQCIAALEQGCDLIGVTLYPVVDHPGWADDRHCENGLWSYPKAGGERAAHEPLLREIRRLRGPLEQARRDMLARRARRAARDALETERG
jgi:hypothetical protein